MIFDTLMVAIFCSLVDSVETLAQCRSEEADGKRRRVCGSETSPGKESLNTSDDCYKNKTVKYVF